jgi:predicted dehydrogenase
MQNTTHDFVLAPKVTTALIGCGQRGPGGHGKVAKASEKLELVAVCDIDEARAKAGGEMLDVGYVTDYNELLSRDDLESVIIATHTKHHGQIAIDAARAKKHILMEKPMVDSVVTAKELIAAAEESDIIGMVAYQLRFTEFARALKQEAAKIEPVQTLMTVQRGMMAPQYFFPDHYGGVIDTASHTIHQALWVMDDTPSGVYATLRRGTFRGDETIDFANLMIECDNGERTATIITSIGGVQTPNIIQIVGKHGTVSSLDKKTLKVVRHYGFNIDKSPIDLEVRNIETKGEIRHSVAEMHDHFADLIRGVVSEQRGTTFYEGMLAVAVTEAMAESAKRGERVPMAEILGD